MHTEKTKLFEKLFKSHYRQLYIHAYGWVYDMECAKDIVHDAFCYLWEHFEKYEDKNLLSLLYAFVRCRCCDYVRHQRARDNYIEYQQTNWEEDYDDYDDYHERLCKVQRLIDKLPTQTKRVFIECVVNQKSYKETAELLNISPLTVKTLLSRAYKHLRENILFFFYI